MPWILLALALAIVAIVVLVSLRSASSVPPRSAS
jgi:hypothetical protein